MALYSIEYVDMEVSKVIRILFIINHIEIVLCFIV